MTLLKRTLPALLLLGLAATASAQGTGFLHQPAQGEATRLEAEIRATTKAVKQTAAQLRQEAQKQRAAGGDAREAMKTLRLAVVSHPRDWQSWLALSEALRAVTPDPAKGGERYDLPVAASGAAYRAFELAEAPADKAAALAVLAETFKSRSLWRPAIEATRASLTLADQPQVRAALEKLRSEHGFRMVDYKIDADAAEPRLCLNFSERIAGGPVEIAKFVAVDGRDPQNLAVENQQVCVEGLAHGKRYEVQVRAGLPSTVGEPLAKPIEIASFVRDRKAAVRVTGRAYVLPSRGQQGIPIVSINTAKVGIEVYRIGDRGLAGLVGQDSFLKQLDSTEIGALRDRHGQRIWKGELDVAERRNEDVTTALPISEAIPKLEPGVYVVSASIPKRRGAESEDDGDDQQNGPGRATQWFIISDLGLTALTGQDGLHAFVRGIGSAQPAAGVTVRLVARNNEVLGTAKTDAQGYVRFDAGLKRGEGGLAPAILVAESGADYAFLDLATAAFDLTDRGVKGREAPGALDAYLFPERGVYRPGEPVHLTGLVRDRAGAAATLPVTLIVSRPDGVEHRRIVLNDQGLGGRVTTLALAPTAMTGTWRLKLHADPKSEPLAQSSFLVEDFVPERLDLKLDTSAPVLTVGETARITVDGRYLYGTPAAGLDLEGEIIVRHRVQDLPEHPGYRFGVSDERITTVRRPLEDLPVTDDLGKAEIAFRLPPVPKTARSLEADILIRLREPGGRTIERRITRPVSLGEARVGVKPLFADDNVADGEPALFDVILLGADGRPVEGRRFKWEVSRLDQRWQWYMRDGQWGYEGLTTARKLASGQSEATPGKPARIATDRIGWGRYRLDVTSEGGDGTVTSMIFRSGWSASETNESPETLEIALDKATYKAGDIARLRITSKEGGHAQIAVLSSGLLHRQQITVPAGGAEIAIPVSEAWMPGAYVTATLFRPMDEAAKRMPGRAIGVKWLGLDTTGHTLQVALAAPAKVKPSARLTVPLKIAGLKPGEDARVTVAAVDVGILNLTRYEAPQPEKWFLAQRRLGIEMRDFYGRLIDGMRAERGRLRSGGDGPGGMGSKGSPPVEATLALFSGVVKVAPDGTAEVGFDMPDFNGTVRLMAVAWSGSRVGSGTTDVIVRDQVALTASGPRFLTLGDQARLEIDVHNIEGPAATYKIAIEQETASALRTSLPGREATYKAGERRREPIAIKPTELGRITYDVRVTGPGGIEVRRRLAFDVKPPSGDIRRTTIAPLAAKGGRIVVSKEVLADLIPASTRITLNVGPTAAMDMASLLNQLDRYPYGCAEQTTSRALPLLYVSELTRRLGIAGEPEIRARIQKAVDRVFEMQDASGAFGIWGPQDGDLWLTAYVTDFLTRAKEQGFPLPPEPFARALDRLQNYLGYAQDFEKGGEARAYALYVLARNGRAPVGDLRYYADTRLDRFSSPLAQAQLGAALSLVGDKERAERVFKAALARMGDTADPKPYDLARADYGSFLRDGAGLLTLAAETGVAKAETPQLATVLARVYRSREYTSTQEQAWMLLATRALAEQARDTKLQVNGAPHLGEFIRALGAKELEAGPVTVTNDGDNRVDAVVSVLGASLTPEPAIAKGFSIERTYYTLDGTKVDLASATGGTAKLDQNTRLIVVVKITATDAGGRVMLVDRLPAGLEIENPRLVDSGDLKGLDWLKRSIDPVHTEFRDDRFVAAFDFFGQRNRRNGVTGALLPVEATVAYMVRAVTPGTFVHPAATVEDMYRPDRHARSASGRLEITAGK